MRCELYSLDRHNACEKKGIVIMLTTNGNSWADGLPQGTRQQ
mgnify:CR=1 FL=1|tara:strand:- start:706 stop:831 length:126 start_codon:yes stop_codon:yes gene_type:complete